MTPMLKYPPLIEALSDYVPSASKDQLVWIIGKLLADTRLPLSAIKKRLQLTKDETEELVGFILQSGLIEARVIKNEFILTKFPELKYDHKTLSKREKRLLGYLKLRGKIDWDELSWIFKDDIPSLESDLYSLSLRGFVKLSKRENWLLPTLKYTADEITYEDLTLEQKYVVGLTTMFDVVSVEVIADLLQLPSDRVLTIFMDLAISNAVLARVIVETSFFKKRNLFLESKGFTINFPHRSVAILENDEKLVIGYVYLRRELKLKQLIQALEIPEENLVRILANLTATKIFQFRLTDDLLVSPAENIIFQPFRSIDEISMLSLFNYHMLLGIIASEKTISIKALATRMNEHEFEVLRGLITLTLEGFVKGYLTNKEVFVLTELRDFVPFDHETRTLQDWEKIAIGLFTARRKITIQEFAKILGINPKDALQKAYSLQVRKQFEGEILLDKVILVHEVPTLPPLIQPEDLSETEKVILGYLYTHQVTHLKHLQKLINARDHEIRRIIYKLIGSGLVRVREDKNKFELLHRPTIKPSRKITELEGASKIIAQIIEDGPPPPTIYNISRLAEILHFTTKETVKKLYVLLAEGYYNGVIEKERFHLRSIQEIRLGKPICLNCHQELENPKEPCPHCHAPPPKCSVCKGTVISTDPLLKCPHCGQPAHASHIKEWLKIKSECPYCREPLRESDLKPVT